MHCGNRSGISVTKPVSLIVKGSCETKYVAVIFLDNTDIVTVTLADILEYLSNAE
jgi:hypothetical protein